MKIYATILTIILLFVSVISGYETGLERDNKIVIRTADFMTTLNYLLEHEGYYANVKHDRGKETYSGITRKYNPKWYGWKYIDKYKRNGKVKWNTRIQELDYWVLDFYLDIWVKEGFYKLKDQSVANYLFDFRVHAGYAGVKTVKKVMKEMGYEVDVDKVFTEDNLLLINKINKRKFLKKLKKERISYYTRIVNHDDTQKVFLSHWISRANNITL